MATPDQVLERLSRTTEQILGRDDLCDRLASGRPLRIKFGVDARNAPDLHLGHAVNLWMMRYLQDLGHVVVFLLGDTTTESATRRAGAAPAPCSARIRSNGTLRRSSIRSVSS